MSWRRVQRLLRSDDTGAQEGCKVGACRVRKGRGSTHVKVRLCQVAVEWFKERELGLGGKVRNYMGGAK